MMTKEKRIHDIFEILNQYEMMQDKVSTVTEESYKNYLDRLYIWYLGYGNEEIYMAIKGLYTLGKEAKHGQVKRIVFYIIDILNNGG